MGVVVAKEPTMSQQPSHNPDLPTPVPPFPVLPDPPVKEPDPDRLPDEDPIPNPDENDRPPKWSQRPA
jgi:hypothetical protein